MKLLSICQIALVTIALLTHETNADVQSFVGDWRHTIITEDEHSTLSCRMLNVTVRRYSLRLTPDERLQGQYGLATNRVVLGSIAGCDNPPTLTNMEHRADWWAVLGSLEENGRLDVTAEYDRCYGVCSGVAAKKAFNTKLSIRNGSLVDFFEDTNQRFFFLKEKEASNLESDASQSLSRLLRPLHERNCVAFLQESMDPQASAALPRTEFCMTTERITKLLGEVLAFETTNSTLFDNASFVNHSNKARLNIKGSGDVLVEYLVILDGQGNGVLSWVIMRRQPQGDWKILFFMP
ncbi:hypothetical protein [Roseibium sp.]|uniref:hypothetical protein n=1 Tax=Roseibium sp. TaxID=1936156 RepID=UPI003BAB720B